LIIIYHQNKEKMETAVKPITVETIVNAPVEKVWNYWNAPEHITKWCQASDDWHAPFAENDARTGGKFKTRMEAKDGSMGFDFGGVYSNVEPNKVIEYAMDDGRKVKVEFADQAGRTKVTETFDPESTNPVEMQRGGWQAILDNFRKYTEAN
jgi:uncharacterized protein YndB with AHSA1/START domain